jgi:outer membrane protein
MKNPGIVIILYYLMILCADAQSNPSLVATNTVVGGRRMSLQDCIQEALQHNFDIQIHRYNPEISLYNLRANYGSYDPMFDFSASHSYNVQPAGHNSQDIPYPSTTAKDDSFGAGVGGSPGGGANGLLPWGMTYSFAGSVDQQHFDSAGISTPSSSGSAAVNVEQPLLQNFWIDKTRMNIKVAKNALRYNEQDFRYQLITSITAVEDAYYDLIYQLEYVKVQQEALDLSQTQLDQDKQRLQIGTLAQLSVQQDQSQVAQNQASLIAAQNKLQTGEDTLKNLITDNFSKWRGRDIQPTEPLAAPLVLFDLQDSWNRGLTERPEYLQAKLNVEKQGIQLKYDFNQLFPQLDLTASYGYNGQGFYYNGVFSQIEQRTAPFHSYGAQLSMPLSNYGPRNTYKSDKVTAQQLLLTLKQLEQTIMVGIDEAIKTAQSDYQSVQATRQARIYAEAALDAEEKTYAVGKATTFEVLTYQNNLTVARGNELQALDNYEKDLTALDQQEGSTLEKLGINIEAN